MRVCMVAYTFYESDNRVMRYAETLAARGDQVDVIALRHPGQLTREVLEQVSVSRVQDRTRNETGKLSYLLRVLFYCFRAMALISWRHLRKPYDLVHVHSVPDFLVFTAWLPRLTGAKVILDIHDILPEFYASKFNQTEQSFVFRILVAIERVSSAFAHHVIVANDLWRETLTNRTLSADKCTTMLNTPDLAVFSKKGRIHDETKFVIIYPGSLNWHQGLDIAIRAMAEVKDTLPNAELHIYGDGNEKETLVRLSNELGVGEKVCFNSAIPIREIARRIENADLGIVPKRANSFGDQAFSTKILEFMCLGVPVIVSSTRVDRFYFNESVVQFYRSGDVSDLAQCIVLLAQDVELRSALRNRAGGFVQRMTWDLHSNRYIQLVDSLTGNAGSKAAIPEGSHLTSEAVVPLGPASCGTYDRLVKDGCNGPR